MLTPRSEYLFARYWNREASPEEREELMSLLRSDEHDEDLKTLVDQAMSNTPEMKMDEESAALILQNILSTRKEQIPVIPFRKKIFIRVAAAAATIAVMVSGYYLFFYKKEVIDQPIAKHKKVDIAPGGNKAILTLGNGSKIFLDSVQNGTLAEQGNAKITKLNNGQLAYDAVHEKQTAVIYNTLSTPKGGQYQLELPDGTKVWLNAASSITYPTSFTGNERKVNITGEAYFEVKKDPRMPFTVSTGETSVQVLGTHFNINAYTDEPSVNTTLLEGSVKIIDRNRTVLIKPGQRAEVKDGIKIIDDVDLDASVAWKNGKFQFGDAADVKEIMRQIARWYDVDVEYQGNITGHIGGTISRNVNASQVFNMLEMTGTVRFNIEGKKVIVMP